MFKVPLVQQVLKVSRVLQVLVVQQEVMDLKVIKVAKVLLVQQVLQDLKVIKVFKVLQVLQVLKVIKVYKVPLDQQVAQVVLDQLDLKVLKETLVVLHSTIHLNLTLQMPILVQEILD